MNEPNHSNPYHTLGIAPVINAAGKMTALGGSAQSAEVAAALADAAQVHVDLAELRRAAGARIAKITGAEDASITTGAAAGIAISVAAILTGTDLQAIRRLPRFDGPKTFLLQAGHDINFGADVEQMIRLGGGEPRIFGSAERVEASDLRGAMDQNVAGLVYVKSHHCVQDNRLALAEMIQAAARAQVPVLVDAAAEEDLQGYLTLGADLVIYSGGKAIGGPTSGFIAGRADLIEACEAQHRGIARTMKVGKEQVMGLMAALHQYTTRRSSDELIETLHARLGALPGIDVRLVADRAGRPIKRVAIASTTFDISALARHLSEGSPSIRTRNHQLESEGYLLLDGRELRAEHVQVIARRVSEFLREQGGFPSEARK